MLARNDHAGRRVLCVFPRYTPSFGTFEFSYPLTDNVRAFMPPQGLLVIAAAVPPSWPVRFIDENMAPATDDDFAWAEVVFVSGMHVQRRQIEDIRRRAQSFDKVAVLGGSSVSACPEHYPDFDYLHVGELGDATDELFARLSDDVARPQRQVVLTTKLRRELSEFPIPAYELAQIDRYLLGSIQFSSGCPYQCEFCDIPALYGRVARYKTPEQVCAELDKLVACGLSTSVYFVDDNFIANKKAVREMLPHLIEWQRRNNYPLLLSCEATLNIAKRPEILELMHEALFTTIFCGIETPDPAALKAMSKQHNMMVPLLEGIETINSFGMEVVSGIIMGLDTDTADTGRAVLEFVEPVEDSDADHEPAAGAAAHAAVGPPQARGPADRGRRPPRIQRRVPPALRPGGGDVARVHACRLPAGSPDRALRAPDRGRLSQALQAAEPVAARHLEQHQARADDPVAHGLAHRHQGRLPAACSGGSR